MIGVLLLPVVFAAPPLPLHNASGPCADQRYPSLAGEWVLACDNRRRVAKAVHLSSRRTVEFAPGRQVGASPGRIHISGHGYLQLGRDTRAHDESTISTHRTWPGLSDSFIATVQQDGTLEWGDDSTKESWSIESPRGRWGTAPAVTAQGIAWVANGNDGDTDLWWTPLREAMPRPVDVGPEPQTHVQASGDWIAWVSGQQIKLWNTATDERESIDARTGFNAPISLWENIVCWEERSAADVDIRCSDGVSITRAGHQTHPQRWDHWLLYRENEQLMLQTLEDAP